MKKLALQSIVKLVIFDILIYQNIKNYQVLPMLLSTVVVKSGQLALDTDNPIVTIASKLVSLIPLIGNQISDTIEALWNFIKGTEMKNRAMRIVKFSTTSEEFNEIMQEVIINFIDNNKDLLLELSKKSKPIAETWYEKVKDFCKNIKTKIEETIWVQEFETPMQQIGNQDASRLISEQLGTGEIYQGEIPIKVSIDEKKERLLKYIIVVNNREDNNNINNR
jgi:hypothetical protein